MDGHLVYEVNQIALRAQTNDAGERTAGRRAGVPLRDWGCAAYCLPTTFLSMKGWACRLSGFDSPASQAVRGDGAAA